ncbi:MAG: nucleotidyl transferase AbiEii/AbiGii toxin family protein [Deltaproteobacteria bacterium]|nr:nucleotidyl transferase AbiEii/AbiGii toxin family protein [Deltaproteobacteria bacterium]MBW2738690.1 nucleotidyl transferase AbiEii/AbiGii toxin family protein [Deltaproteobacteria bacterium]
MIDKSEIMDFSREFGIVANVIEKDYVLAWVLAGIFNHTKIGSSWVFKGGTCLKKCYFETYRFSEDLDFTLSEANHLDQELLVNCFKDISEWVYDAAGIEIPKNLIRFDVYENKRGGISAQGRIGYSGPMQPRGDLPRIKLDLTTDEVLVLDPVVREVHHPYSDLPDEGIQIRCYCFEEVFAEKIRALAERERPRDLYDVVHLYRHDGFKPDQTRILSTLEKKCEFKEMPVPKMETFRNRPEREELEAEWKNMLAHQLPALPPFAQFWKELPEIMEWLHGTVEKTVKQSISSGRVAIDETWRPPSMSQAWHTEAPLEKIRFASANRLCVNLHYNGSYRLIEPYSLRRSQAGNLLLFALKHETEEWRSYRVDRIQDAEVTKTSFVPKHAVELTPSGPISAPGLTRNSGRISFSRPTVRRSRSIKPSFGQTYVIECPYCGKKFNHKKMNTRLNKHKDKNGYPCSGKNGYLVDTKY